MRTRPRPRPQHTLQLAPLAQQCPECRHTLWNAYLTRRTITTLEGLEGGGASVNQRGRLISRHAAGMVALWCRSSASNQ